MNDLLEHVFAAVTEKKVGLGKFVLAGKCFREGAFHPAHKVARVVAKLVLCGISKNGITFRRRAELVFVSV